MMRRPDFSRAATMACRVLDEQRIDALPVNPLMLLRKCRDTQVMTVPEAAETLGLPEAEFEKRFGLPEAMTFRMQSEGSFHYIVVYRPDGNPARLRFTLAHELGHRLLRHEGNERWEEQEADCFASHLLCPRPALELLARRFDPLSAEQAAAAFYVSVSCVRTVMLAEPVDVDESLLERVGTLLTAAVAEVREIGHTGNTCWLPKRAERFWKTNA